MANFYQKLERLLIKVGLSEKESRFVMKAYVFPGLPVLALGKQCGFKKMTTYRLVERLTEMGFLTLSEKDGKRLVQPVSLSEIARLISQKSKNLMRFASELDDLHEFLGPAQEAPLQFEKYYGDAAKEVYFDILYRKWDSFLALGDFEAYADAVTFDFEKQWINKRVKHNRSARAVMTTDGKWTKEVIKTSDDELRDTLVVPGKLRGKFISIFPEINTTIIYNGSQPDSPHGSCTKVVSKDIAESYQDLVLQYF